MPFSLHHVPRLPGVSYPTSGTQGNPNTSCKAETNGVLSGASRQPNGAWTDRMDLGRKFLTSSTRAPVSGSLAGAVPAESTVSRVLSRTERDPTFPCFQFEVTKFRLRSTPAAFPRVPRETPSGLAHNTTAVCSRAFGKWRKDRLKRNVVSGSSPWIPATTSSSVHSEDGKYSKGAPSTDRP